MEPRRSIALLLLLLMLLLLLLRRRLYLPICFRGADCYQPVASTRILAPLFSRQSKLSWNMATRRRGPVGRH